MYIKIQLILSIILFTIPNCYSNNDNNLYQDPITNEGENDILPKYIRNTVKVKKGSYVDIVNFLPSETTFSIKEAGQKIIIPKEPTQRDRILEMKFGPSKTEQQQLKKDLDTQTLFELQRRHLDLLLHQQMLRQQQEQRKQESGGQQFKAENTIASPFIF
ncbi:hypothetical protein [Candidatus Tisiphia endosymbiont of Beris chalybata]|uniref:hypothetical protein n=1 Tax=Candidatus Tisiphia endosymbiont of Beris chalybata TaxID=3066262 RepID=UPI00312CC077